ncbi:carbohydrate porin [Cohaesibacter celericrescens]|uniref:carbohydrate porin n=1 Tax=Cohaesibacter celericrescens TaxID=2067669 RepID=UPI0015E09D15|nr:carbohydrate porin [Cohaesibacter celericrescens]
MARTSSKFVRTQDKKTFRKTGHIVATCAALGCVVGLGATQALAADDNVETSSPSIFSGLVDYLNGPGVPGPLAPLGEKLHEVGITPRISMLNILLANPSMGQETGKHERVTIFNLGFDTDLEKLVGLPGSTVRFQSLYVPDPFNIGTFGAAAGDSFIGHSGPYIPKQWHLNQLTFEQKLFDDRFEAAFGVDNAGNYFGKALCNQSFLCQGASLQDGVGMNPPPYSNWSARASYDLTPEWTAQVGFWRDNSAFPFSTGWEGWSGSVTAPNGAKIVDPNSSLYLANLVYETTAQTDLYPKRYEAMLYYNDAEQTNPNTGEKHDGTSGIYIGGRQTVWRQDETPTSTSLSLYASMYASFDQDNSFGLGSEVDAGVILQGPFESRPFDSYSLKFAWNHLTDDEQSYLEAQNTGTYTVGPDQFMMGVDANFMLAGNTIVQPWANYTWNVNTFENPSYSGDPDDGFSVGVNMVLLLDKALGL